MTGILVLEQALNGLQFGLMLFLLAAGLTLVFGIMDMINLAHGSLYMVGAYLIASDRAGQRLVLAGAGARHCWPRRVLGVLLELTVLRRLYQRDHLSQVLGTFAILLMCNEAVRMVWGSQPIALNPPAALAGPVELLPGFHYPAYRLFIIGVGLAAALAAVPAGHAHPAGHAGARRRLEPRDGAGHGHQCAAPVHRRCLAWARRCARWPAACSGRCWRCRSAWARAS